MKIIGIFGKSGAGKTTLSKLIQDYDKDNIEVVHLDSILDDIKIRILGKNVKRQIDYDGNDKIIINKKIKLGVLRSEFFREIIYKKIMENKIGSSILKRKIERAEKSGKKAMIVEGSMLNNYKITEKFYKKVKIEASFKKRFDRVQKRQTEPIDKEEMVLRDKSFFKNTKKEYQYFIENDGNMEKLRVEAKKIYNLYIKDKEKNKLQERYGGYKISNTSINVQLREKEDNELTK